MTMSPSFLVTIFSEPKKEKMRMTLNISKGTAQRVIMDVTIRRNDEAIPRTLKHPSIWKADCFVPANDEGW